jgi:hypothetical protein
MNYFEVVYMFYIFRLLRNLQNIPPSNCFLSQDLSSNMHVLIDVYMYICNIYTYNICGQLQPFHFLHTLVVLIFI